MSPQVYFSTIALIVGTILAVFGMKYFAAWTTARARIVDAHNHDARLAAMEAEITRLSASVGKIESILKEVE